MKKILLFIVEICILVATVQAQGISFTNGTWTEILEKAKQENKLIFVDVYTSWCGPCKRVAATVFPDKNVGELYNKMFINYSLDAEKGEGPVFVKKYGVSAYPSFFYMDGNGRVIYQFIGAKGSEEFIKIGEMIPDIAREGGMGDVPDAIMKGTASAAMFDAYYLALNKKDKPAAMNSYLMHLPAERLLKEARDRCGEMVLYDPALLNRLADVLISTSKDGRFADGKMDQDFMFHLYALQYQLSQFLEESIRNNDLERFRELLCIKEKFRECPPQVKNLDGDLVLRKERGLFFASPEYLWLCYWSQNRVNPEEFKTGVRDYMDKLMRENRAESVTQPTESGIALNMIIPQPLRRTKVCFYDLTGANILAWADYYWKLSPSNKKTRTLCATWIKYVFQLQPYNAGFSLTAADLLARIGMNNEGISILETALDCQQKLSVEQRRLVRELEWKLQDAKNQKL